jgi:hypothetical protein
MNPILIALVAASLTQAPAADGGLEAASVVAPVPAPAAAPAPVAEVPAAPKPASAWYDRVKLSGVTFLRYSVELTPSGGLPANFNEFNFDRIYLTSEFQISDHLLANATIEAGDIRSSGTGNFMIAPKLVYLEAKDLGYAGTYLRAGLVQTGWVPYADGLWGYRVVSPSFMDRWGYLTSTDLGLTAGGPLPAKYGSWQLNLINGEGWKVRELGKRKEGQVRLVVKPLASLGGIPAGFFVGGFGDIGGYDDVKLTVHTKRRVIGQVGFQNERLTVAFNYTLAQDASEKYASKYAVMPAGDTANMTGLDAVAVLNLGLFAAAASDAELFARAEQLDPDVQVADNDVQMLQVGGSYRVNKYLRLVGDWERVVYGPANNLPNESRLKVHAEAKF